MEYKNTLWRLTTSLCTHRALGWIGTRCGCARKWMCTALTMWVNDQNNLSAVQRYSDPSSHHMNYSWVDAWLLRVKLAPFWDLPHHITELVWWSRNKWLLVLCSLCHQGHWSAHPEVNLARYIYIYFNVQFLNAIVPIWNNSTFYILMTWFSNQRARTSS